MTFDPDLLGARATALTPADFLGRVGEVFAVFDRQDSANVSYGLRVGMQRYFVKTAGAPDAPALLPHAARVDLLDNAVRVARSIRDPALPRLHHRIETPHGPMLVYDWVPGELLGVPRAQRADPAAPFLRFKSLPLPRVVDALTTVFRVHDRLEANGWCAGDFYDGCLIYDFTDQTLHLIDLDHYQPGPYRNHMGRMFGSDRFMAPEEYQLGATIDAATTVFNLGRCITVFLRERCLAERSGPARAILAIEQRACQPNPADRFPSVHALRTAWEHDVVTSAKSC